MHPRTCRYQRRRVMNQYCLSASCHPRLDDPDLKRESCRQGSEPFVLCCTPSWAAYPILDLWPAEPCRSDPRPASPRVIERLTSPSPGAGHSFVGTPHPAASRTMGDTPAPCAEHRSARGSRCAQALAAARAAGPAGEGRPVSAKCFASSHVSLTACRALPSSLLSCAKRDSRRGRALQGIRKESQKEVLVCKGQGRTRSAKDSQIDSLALLTGNLGEDKLVRGVSAAEALRLG